MTAPLYSVTCSTCGGDGLRDLAIPGESPQAGAGTCERCGGLGTIPCDDERRAEVRPLADIWTDDQRTWYLATNRGKRLREARAEIEAKDATIAALGIRVAALIIENRRMRELIARAANAIERKHLEPSPISRPHGAVAGPEGGGSKSGRPQ